MPARGWGGRGRKEGRRKRWRGGGGGGGGSVTLEKIRRLSSPLMTVEIVFLCVCVCGGVVGAGGQNAKAQQFVLCL